MSCGSSIVVVVVLLLVVVEVIAAPVDVVVVVAVVTKAVILPALVANIVGEEDVTDNEKDETQDAASKSHREDK